MKVVLLTAMEFLRDSTEEETDLSTKTSSNMAIGTSHEALTYTSSNMAIGASGADDPEELVPEIKTTVFNDSFCFCCQIDSIPVQFEQFPK